ncbi:MAG: glycoside hydrolase family 3 protein [Vulcanimicrobiaceae bacterium]
MSRNELERLAGSVLCVGFPSTNAAAVPVDELRALGPAGIVLFARNVSTREATAALVARAADAFDGPSPIVAIDHEGGRVARLRDTEIPSMMALGASGDLELAARAGERLGRELRAIGATVNFAPVADLALEARNVVIGTRAFGDDPERAGAFGAALIGGLQRAGVSAVSKHFPGHGATISDSHRELPKLTVDGTTLRAREFVPFARAITGGVRAIMLAHIVAIALDPERPASLSPRAYAILRRELGFDGLCITDCLEMSAIADGIGVERGAPAAIAAGADLALISHRLDRAWGARDAIARAVEDGELPFARLADAAERVERFRWQLPGETLPPDDALVDVGRQIAERSITLVRGRPSLDPALPVTIVSFAGADAVDADELAGDRITLNLALRRRRIRSESMRAPLDPTPEMTAHLCELVELQPRRTVVVAMHRAHLYDRQRETVAALLAIAPDAHVVSLAEPFDVICVPQARNVLCSYGDDPVSIEALANVLAGRAVPSGRLPVRLGAGATAEATDGV